MAEDNSWVMGHHIYKRVWTPVLGEVLDVRRNRENPVDVMALGVYREGVLVGHVPRELRDNFFFYLRKGGTIKATVTGRRENQRKRGLEVPVL